MHKSGTLQYKCRRCGETFDGPLGGGDIDMVIIRLLTEESFYAPCATVTAKTIHHCTLGERGIGIADVIGARYKESDDK